MKAIINYLQEVRVELKKVVWPKREQVVKLTVIIFIISTLVAVYMGGLDFGLTKLLETLILK
ncbi:preprotein translocase subunit SecE [Patescibacteria group bacterium]|nr:preprotein translocase subunit SecE [Patescibacteria group bacterium]